MLFRLQRKTDNRRSARDASFVLLCLTVCMWAAVEVNGTAIALSASSALEPDVVEVLSKTGGPSQRKRGEIVQYDRREIRLKQKSGSAVRIATRDVLSVTTNRNASHVRGDQLFAEKKYQESYEAYAEAVRQESRQWVIEMIFKKRIEIALILDQPLVACRTYVRLVTAHAETPYFYAIPLSWTSRRLESGFETEMTTMLDSEESEIQSLLACSWLLGSPARQRAIDKLKVLAQSQELDVAQLAKSQLWRTQISTASDSDAQSWEAQLLKMETRLRAGPYFVLAQLQQRQNKNVQAVANLMRLPIVYKDQYQLAARALQQSVTLLEEQKDLAGAERLTKELARDYAHSRVSIEASQRVDDQFKRSNDK